MRNMTKSLIAEFIGTFALILLGAGAGTLAGLGLGGTLVTVALAHGLTIMIFAYAFGDISGSIINPAATIGVFLGGGLPGNRVVPYIAVQLLGAVAAGFVLLGVFGEPGRDIGLGATVVAEGTSVGMAFLLEFVGTFFLVNSILNAAVAGKAGNMAPFAIGMTVAACILMFGPLTGASLNPARTLGPAIAAGEFSDLWLFMVATTAGAAVAGVFNRYYMQADADSD